MAIYLLFLLVPTICSIKLNNGAYEDVNIVIQDSVAENDQLIDRIKEVFTKTSRLLFTATRNQVYFGKINIILPKTWAHKPEYQKIPAVSEFDSYITVESGSIKTPHTKSRTYKCGEQGWFIYLTPEFLFTEGFTEWGRHESVIVHEWGHFRWGLFDEYATVNTNSKFYLQNGTWAPISCTQQITGNVGVGTQCKGGLNNVLCDINNSRKIINRNCNFCPDPRQENGSLASLMGYQWIDGVSFFCDSGHDGSVPLGQLHDKAAPNTHNLLCKSKSAWEVMREHKDFISGVKYLPGNTSTTPNFTILLEVEAYRVFVLDVSGSMSSNEGQSTRIEILHQACTTMINHTIPTNSWLGIVWFHTDASIKMHLTQVTSQNDRNNLMAAIPSTTLSSTCIGCGIETAIEVLKYKQGDIKGSEIIVVSDGENNEGNLDASVLKAVSEGVIIHTLAVTQNADNRLINMATATGGKHFSYLSSSTISFAAAFAGTITGGATSQSSESTTLLSETVNSSGIVQFYFGIDSTIGKDTLIIVLQQRSSLIEIAVSGPDGMSQQESTTADSLTLKINGTAKAGIYNVTITTSITSSLEYHVTSYPIDQEVIRVTARVSPENFDFAATNTLPVIIATVMKGRAPVLNANVAAIVESDSDRCSIPLLDNGADPDAIKNDGSYAGTILTKCLANERINVKVYAKGENGTALVLTDLNGAGSSFIDDESDMTEPINNSFQRVIVAEELYVSNFLRYAYDRTPPGRITDVSIVHIQTVNTRYGENRNFTITWTAPGDDANIGQASEYEMRISEDIDELIHNFAKADILPNFNGNFTPKYTGETESIRMEINAEETFTSNAYFAVRAKDEAGNYGDISNIVSIVVAKGYRVAVETDVVYSFTDEDETEQAVDEIHEKSINAVAIGVGCAGAVVVVTGAAVLICVQKIKSKPSISDSVIGSQISTTTVFSIDLRLKDFYSAEIVKQTAAKKSFQSSLLPTAQDHLEAWSQAFASRPCSPYPNYDVLSQGGCSIQMLDEGPDATASQIEEYLYQNNGSISSALQESPSSSDDLSYLSSGANKVALIQEGPETSLAETTDGSNFRKAQVFQLNDVVPGNAAFPHADIYPPNASYVSAKLSRSQRRQLKRGALDELLADENSLECGFPPIDSSLLSQEVQRLYDSCA